jgi:sulfate permease, SulP family
MTAGSRGRATTAGLLPVVTWIGSYQRSWLRPDLLGALTVWTLLVPQAIAYAQIAGLPPAAGLFATAAGLAGYALLGTSRQLIVSPTSSTAAISAALVAPLAVGDPVRFASLTAALAVLAGLALVAFGRLQMGFVARFIVASVQVGFMFGLGLTIITGQLPKMLGTPSVTGDFITEVGGLLPTLGQVDPWTIAIGFGSLVALQALRRVAPGLPAALLVIVVAIGLVLVLGLQDRGVAVLGQVDGAVPLPAIPAIGLSDVGALLPGALIIAVIGYAEGITVAERIAEVHHYDIRTDQELIATGGANILSGLFQGFIVGGGASQSAANDRAGSQTPLVSLIVAGLTVLTVIALLPLFRDLPQAVLGAIVVNAVLGFLDLPALRRLAALRRNSAGLAVVTTTGVLVLGVLPGLVLAVTISIGAYLVRLARPSGSILGRAPSGAWVAVEHDPGAAVDPAILVYRLNGPLVAVNAKHLRGLVHDALVGRDPRPATVVLDLGYTPELDVGSIDDLVSLHRELAEDDIGLALGNVHADVHEMLRRSGLTEVVGATRIHRHLADAVANERRDTRPNHATRDDPERGPDQGARA